jgi:hypothetical protein
MTVTGLSFGRLLDTRVVNLRDPATVTAVVAGLLTVVLLAFGLVHW